MYSNWLTKRIIMQGKKEFYSVAELAKKLKISRIAVHKRIKKGRIKAIKIGRAYAVPKEEITELQDKGTRKYGEIVIYKGRKGSPNLGVKLEKDSVWLTQKQIAILFDTQRPAITKHLINIFKDKELNENSVSSVLEHTATDGKKYYTRFYNLDAIISVGYRVNSKRASDFRIWATKILKNHLVKGYTINEKRLKQIKDRFRELQKAVSFISGKVGFEALKTRPKELLSIVDEYSKTLTFLNEYDEDRLRPVGKEKPKVVLEYEECTNIINNTRQKLIEKGEAGELFGKEIQDKFKSVTGALYQTFGGQKLYSTTEEKAAHLLYFVIKDHPFADGNKRIGSLLFVRFLEMNKCLFKDSGEKKINDNALTVLALLIAYSKPDEKDIMIKIIINLLI